MPISNPRILALLLCASLAACAVPPSNVIVGGTGSSETPALDLGNNAAREPCTLQRTGADADIYCGTYLQPAGHVTIAAQAGDPGIAVTASAWRAAFDRRFQCGSPSAATVQGTPGVAMQCSWRQGGWPQVVLATRINGTLYIADAVKPVEAVAVRAIGVMSGAVAAVPAPKVDRSGVAAQRQAAQATNVDGVGAIARVAELTASGAAENRRGNYVASEAAYRAAVTIQERILGRDNPALAVSLARLALQVSNQNRFQESAPLFARAMRLAALPNQPDQVAKPLVEHLTGLDLLNRGRPAEALAMLDRADTDFKAVVPPEALVPPRPVQRGGRSGVEQMVEAAATAELFADQTTSDAVNGLIETRRYRAVALRELGRTQDAEAALNDARSLYAGRDPRLVARYYRTLGVMLAASGQGNNATDDLSRAVDLFARTQPDSRPLAETQLLNARQTAAGGDYAAALPLCREAAATLRDLKAGAPIDLLITCLHAYADAAGQQPANGQAILADMFGVSQLAQGGITAQQIALATARLSENARDPRVAEAIRQRDRATDTLADLLRRRAELAASKDTSSAAAALDDPIAKARQAVADAGQVLQAAAPGFASLVQETVPASSALTKLRQGEALVAVVLGRDEGWTFLLRDGKLAVGRIDGGARKVDALVHRFRASIELRPDNTPPPFDTAAAQELYAVVLGPVAAGLSGTKTLIVVPTGSLLSVPFGALLTGPASADALSKAPFLVRQMSITHVPSVASFVNLRAAANTIRARQPWFGFGDFHPPTLRQAQASFPADSCGESARELADLPLLPGAQKELELARRLLGAAPQDELLGAAFTSQGVAKMALKDFRVLHFASHAVLPGELRCQSEPAILASTPANAPDASGAMLTASQVQQMDLDAQLVILAACNTGGPNGADAGESLSGLARAFFFAGARALLVTHWEANDRAMTYLMALFLQNAAANPSAGLASALADAQRRMLDEAVGNVAVLAHPYDWAVAVLIGGVGEGSDRQS